MKVRATLLDQLDMAWSLASLHLDGLTTEECLWRPAAVGLHVHGQVADWPEDESHHVGPPSIAWITWHIGFWWSKVQDPSIERANVLWPGTAEATRTWIASLHDRWVDVVEASDLDSTELAPWPLPGRPFADVVAWANIELTKNAAELGYARFLYAARHA